MIPVMPADLAGLIDPAAEAAYWRQLAREAAADAYQRGYRDGYERGARFLDAAWPAIVAPVVANRSDHLELERRRAHVCCRACRRSGLAPGGICAGCGCRYCDGCPHCQGRDRETFGRPHHDDYPGGVIR